MSVNVVKSGQWVYLADVRYEFRPISKEGHIFYIPEGSVEPYEFISIKTLQKHSYFSKKKVLGDYILSDKHNVNPIDLEYVLDACGIDKVKSVFKCIKKANPNERNKFGDTKLHIAVSIGNLTEVARLLDLEGIDVNAEGYRKDTPLIRAMMSGNDAIIQLLLQHPEIDLDRANKNGITPFVVLLNKKRFSLASKFLKDNPKLKISSKGYFLIASYQPSKFNKAYCEMVFALLGRDDIIDVGFENLLCYALKYFKYQISWQVVSKILELVELNKIAIKLEKNKNFLR